MKRYDKWLLPLLLILLLAGGVYAGQGAAVQPKFRINIKNEGAKLGEATDPRRIRVQYFKPYQPLGVPMFSPGKADEYVWTDKNGQVDFTLPAYDEPIYMILASGGDIGFFLVEKDDDVVINVLKRARPQADSVTFSGRGVEKYTIAMKLERLCSYDMIKGEYPDAMMRVFYPNWPKGGGQDTTTDMADKLEQYCQVTAGFLQQKAAIIESSGMSAKMKKLAAYNFAPVFDYWVTRVYYTFYNNGHSVAAKAMIDKYRKQFAYPIDPLMALASKRLSSLAKSEYKLKVMDAGGESKVKYEDMYHLFTGRYSGPVRELLIANFLMRGDGWSGSEQPSPALIDSLMQDGLQYLSTPIIKTAYTVKLRLSPGKAVFNGKFKDQNGKEVSLASLKGKALLIDFWFTGCGGCMDFHKQFHKDGYPLLKDNKDFVYVSISIDKQKEMWLKSMASGAYTSSEYLNLNAEMGANDPFLKYYQRATFPFLIFVDKNGKIYYSGALASVKTAVQFIHETLRIPYQG